jgi:hypothetical protein
LRKILLLPFLLLLLLSGRAQDRREAWLRVNVVHWYVPQRAIGLELHHRTQANYITDDNNIFLHPLVTIVRPWLYWRTKKNWTLSYSPLSYHGFTTIKNSLGETDTYTELRSTLGIQRNFTLKGVANRNRAWYEFRFMDVGSDAFRFATRLRIQNAIIAPIVKLSDHNQLSYQLTNEFFWAVQSGYTGFDHNRLYNSLQWRTGKQEMSLGFQWSVHKMESSFQNRRQVFLNTSFEL